MLRLHDYCRNPKCKCQKQITFTPQDFQMEGTGFENTKNKIFKGSQTAWKKPLRPAVNVAAPFIGKVVSGKTKIENLYKLPLIF